LLKWLQQAWPSLAHLQRFGMVTVPSGVQKVRASGSLALRRAKLMANANLDIPALPLAE